MRRALWTGAGLLACLACSLSAGAAQQRALPVSLPAVGTKQLSEPMNRRTRSTKSRQFLLSGEAPPVTRGVRLYSSLQLECEFLGSPPPTIDWLRGGSLHHKAGLIGDLEEETNSLETLSHGGIAATRSRLYLDCVTPRDQGQYTCRGSTGRELATSSTQLKITGPASADDLLACEQAKEASFRPARIVQWRVRLLAKMGSRIRLPCDATGFPAPVITWTRSFHPVMDEDERVTVTEKGHLIIDSLQWSDMGVYQCTATNDFSSSTVTSFVYPFKSKK